MTDLVLSVDQGSSNGVLASLDAQGAGQIADTLARSGLMSRFNVCIGLNFNMPWWGEIGHVLDQFANRGLYFVADAISSDTLAGGGRPNNFQCPYAAAYGVSTPLAHYTWLVQYWGSWFRGLRFHEVLTMAGAMQQLFPQSWWAPIYDRIPPGGAFYQRAIAEEFVRWCRDNGRPLFWSEPVTSAMNNPGMAPLEAEVRALSNLYPNTIIPVWANNVAGVATTGNARRYLDPYNPTRWGLSVQTWGNPGGRATGQEGVLAASALRAGASVVLFEALNGWLKWPDATWGQASDAAMLHTPQWSDRGAALPAFQGLVQGLLS